MVGEIEDIHYMYACFSPTGVVARGGLIWELD